MTTHYTLHSEISVLNEDQMRALLQAVADDQEVMDLLTEQLSLAWSGLRHLLSEIDAEAIEKAKGFKAHGPGFGVAYFSQIRRQFQDMANGGDGDEDGSGNIRDRYYKGKPDRYFQMVCDQMGWTWRR